MERIKADRQAEMSFIKDLVLDLVDSAVDSAVQPDSPLAAVDPAAASLKAPSPAAMTASVLSHAGRRKQILKAAREVEVSERIKEHVAAIATALIDDMTQGIRDEVASDPRIQKRCIKPRRQLEKEIIRQYQREMSERRKEKLAVYNFVTTTALSGLSTAAYAAVRSALQKMGGRGMLPTVTALRQARKELEEMSMHQMGVYETPDGWFVSARAVVEHEILRIMQVVDHGKGTRHEAGGRVVGIGPDGHGWQDRYHVKIQLDARRITRRTSQTEVMLLIIPKGPEGVDRCQKAVYQRTVGIWTGKDSRDNVQANMEAFFGEIDSLQTKGVVYRPAADSQPESLAGVWQQIEAEGVFEGSEAWKQRNLRRVGLDFWLGADMAAQCAVLGHGCAGNEYCGHCTAHKNVRHIPYELMRVKAATSFQKLADELDMFPSSLYAINACLEGNGGETEHGLRSCTADATFEEEEAEGGLEDEEEPEEGEDAAETEPGMPVPPALIRKEGRKLRGRAHRRTVTSTCEGPDVATLKGLTGWRKGHSVKCTCAECAVPVGTVVRVIPRQPEGGWRKSDWLSKVWPSHNRNRFPFCALHCLMRITEAMFMMITQRCLKNEPVINRLNAGLEKAGICKRLSKVAGVTGVHTYEKLTFEGHQALKLLAEDDGGKMAVTRILESMWPTGDADGEGGAKYVPRVTALWAQWRKVVDLMKERDPSKVAQVDGFERFGKECREFCRLYQGMYHEQHCRSFYLHVLMHHAGDFMRELATEGMFLWMMSNSGVERRHEYGRRAAKKAMTGACWKHKSPALAGKANLFAYLTLKEVLVWQCGTDIVSHSIALKASQQPDSEPHKGGRASDSGETDADAEAYLAETLDEAKRALEVAEMSDEPASTTEAPADGTELEGIERISELFIGRDDLCGVLEQESVAGSDEFEDEEAEVMARRIKDLEDLRGDWLPERTTRTATL